MQTSQTTQVADGGEVPAWARERAEMLQGLYIHGIVFALVNLGLFVIDWVTHDPGDSWWFQWPLMIWGLGFLIHVVTVVFPVFSAGWVDRRAEELARRRR